MDPFFSSFRCAKPLKNAAEIQIQKVIQNQYRLLVVISIRGTKDTRQISNESLNCKI